MRAGGTSDVIVMKSSRTTAALLWLGTALSGFAFAGTTAATNAPTTSGATGILVGKLAEGSEFDRIWSIPTLYKNDSNPLLQELAVIGQLQTQYGYGSDDSGQFGSNDLGEDVLWGDIEVRRFRLGLKARMFGKLSFLNLTDLYPDLSPRIYKRTPETYFTWAENEALNISAGKAELKFNREQEYSSRDLPVFERSALGNMFYGGELTGAWVSGKGIQGGWLYFLGVYGNDRQDEFPDFNGGAMILGKIGYNYTPMTHLDLAEVKFQLLHNTDPGFSDSNTPAASPLYSNCISISNELTKGPFGLTTEFMWGDGEEGAGDVCGIYAMPSWYITEKLQLISVIELAGGSEDNAVLLPKHFEYYSPGDDTGDRYFATFAGLNYYVYGHKLKLMSGVKYSYLDGTPTGDGFDGWTFMAGVRMAF